VKKLEKGLVIWLRAKYEMKSEEVIWNEMKYSERKKPEMMKWRQLNEAWYEEEWRKWNSEENDVWNENLVSDLTVCEENIRENWETNEGE